jgi:hypothetical protein
VYENNQSFAEHRCLLAIVGLVGCATAHSSAPANALSEAGESYDALKALRSGNTNEAIELLESRLDIQTIKLRGLATSEPDTKKRAAHLRALYRIREYRSKFPRKTDSPELDKSVAEALSSAPASLQTE